MLSGLSARRCDLPIGLRRFCFHTCWALTVASSCGVVRAEEIRFAKDIRPILSDACFRCHGSGRVEPPRRAPLGPPQRRLRQASGAHDRGSSATTSERAHSSNYLGRPRSANAPRRRRPTVNGPRDRSVPGLGGTGCDVERALGVRSTTATAPTASPIASRGNAALGWPRNAIDLFVLAQLRREGLLPSPQADRERLARRVALTLTGLPPDPTEVARFVREPPSGRVRPLGQSIARLTTLRRTRGAGMARFGPLCRHRTGTRTTNLGSCGGGEIGSLRHSTMACRSTNLRSIC